ncbi:sensor histidine kinase [Methylorubrum salsuginis]|uniref:histidine kinase n=1 Tax=Methylorubrum salsuginis TaxID=414703 RepID=A0A1I4LQ89_9HYPH|nr:sensor histidine kinase [Methylorubrum salsuginis]SFL92983.1 Histidine kinase-, DNA gyrase B-, and HSP90-like ATPase [Methylorubrum salsuginis]
MSRRTVAVEPAIRVLDAIDDPVVLLDVRGTVLHRNRAACACLTAIVPDDRLPTCRQEDAERLAVELALCEATRIPFHKRLELQEGPTRLRFRGRGTRIEDGPGGRRCILLHLVPEQDRAPHIDEALDAAARREQAERERDQVLLRLYRANQEERLRLARDLHDQTGQHIVGLALGIRALEKHVSTPVGLAEIGQLRARLDEVARELHRIAFALRPTALDDFGLGAAVGRLLADWGVAHGIATDFEATGIAFDLASEVEITLFRLCQEALNNIGKHAACATTVSIAIHYEGSVVSLIIEDDGSGCVEEDLSAARLLARGKLGIVGMRERVGMVGGTFAIESLPGAGTTLVARIDQQGRQP